DTYVYTVNDDQGGSATATLTITVSAVNDAPDAAADSNSTDEDTTLTVTAADANDLKDNDSDADTSDTLSVTAYTGSSAKGAAVTVSADGGYSYNPSGSAALQQLAAGGSTTDTFTYTLSDGHTTDTGTATITVSGVNDAPVGVNDSTSVNEDATTSDLVTTLLSNDTDVDSGATLAITSVNDSTTKGTVLVQDDGSKVTLLTYSGNHADFDALQAGQTATDSFSYTVEDENSATDTATVTVTVNGVNDAPVANNDGVASIILVYENATSANLYSTLLGNDTDADGTDSPSTFVISSVNTTSTLGTVTFNAGTQSLTYAADDASFESLNAPGVAPYATTTTFTYTMEDGHGGSDTATVTINIWGQNDAPVAVADSGSVDEDTVLTVLGTNASAVLKNDTDVDSSHVLTVSSADTASARGATVSVSSDGGYIYNPTAVAEFQLLADGQTLSDTFHYTVSDGQGGMDTGTVTITVIGKDEGGGGGAFPSADLITCGGSESGSIDPKTDKDYYRLDLDAPTKVTITTTTDKNKWIQTIIYDVGGIQVDSVRERPTTTLTRNLDAGIWYILVQDYNNDDKHNNYTVSIGCVAGDAGGTCPASYAITCNSVTSAAIDTNGDVDYYKLDFSGASGPTDVVIYTTGGTDTFGQIYNAECLVMIVYDDDSGADTNFRMEASLDPGIYNLKVRDYYTYKKGDYTLYVECAVDSDDFGDDCASASPIGCGSTTSGNIETAGDEDYFTMVIPETQTVTLRSTGTTDVKATLYQSDCSTVVATDDNTLDGTNFSIGPSLTAGTYYLKVQHANAAGTGAYGLTMACAGGTATYYTVAFTTDNKGVIVGNAIQAVADGASTSTVVADPYDGYTFAGWTITGGGAGETVTYTTTTYANDTITIGNLKSNLSIKAAFNPINHTVTFKAGANGSLKDENGVIYAPGSDIVQATVLHNGTTDVVSAVGDPNYYFLGWSGDYDGAANPLVLTNVIGDMTLTATFGTALTVNFTAGANGSITGDTVQELFPGYDTSAVTAVPDAHYHFGGWSGDVSSMDNPLTVTGVIQDLNIAANFVIDQHSVNFTAGINGSLTGDTNQNVDYGSNSTAVTAVPDSLYVFDQWSGDVTGTANPLTVTNVQGDMEITASFKKDFYTITASVAIADGDTAVRGTISPSGAVSVGHATNQAFTMTPDAGYTIATLMVDGGEVQIVGTTYTFTDVRDEHTIEVTFDVDPPLPGCSASVTEASFESGFVAADAAKFDFTNVDVSTDGTLALQTGTQAIDPEDITVPFTQEVAVTFLFEGAGYNKTDFGWLLASEGIGGTKHEVYQNVNDNNQNGVIDVSASDSANAVGDINDDGYINAKDNKVVLGTFAGGTEIVFYLKVDNESKTFYTKKDWNPDTYSGGCKDGVGVDVTKYYRLGKPLSSEGSCQIDYGWLSSGALTRLGDIFDFDFNYNDPPDADDVETLVVTQGEKFEHVIVGAPGNKPNEWILGWEDLGGGGDTDHNDLVFHIERRTGGTAQLESDEAIEPVDPTAYYTAVTFSVIDSIPCAGETAINYYLSIDNGTSWVEVTDWDEIRTSDSSRTTTGTELVNWVPGTPQYTYRTVRIDFSERGYSGRELIWRAEMGSEREACVPEILSISLDGAVATNGSFARSSPVTQTNMIFSGTYETPAGYWTDKTLRGHLTATRIYDPAVTTATDSLEIWDAGSVLTARDPDTRSVYYPEITVTEVASEQLFLEDGVTEARGDGTTVTFKGTLAHAPISATTLLIYDGTTPAAGHEKFSDIHTEDLVGHLGGAGTINRFTGAFEVTFNSPPDTNVPITATYAYYTTSSTLKAFNTTNVTSEMLGLQRGAYIIPDGFEYDFNSDDRYNNVDKNGLGVADDSDGDWLVQWVRGWKNPGATPKVKKEWVLGPLDHSVPAVMTPPGRPKWYFGTAISTAERDAFDTFRTDHETRQAVIFVGAKDGMIHAFDGGEFRWGDNVKTSVEEARGYFLWDDFSSECPTTPANTTSTRCNGVNGKTCSECPDYGTGEELWAFIPANLVPRLKNNLTKGDDQAYVDASPTVADVYIDTDLTDTDETKSWRTVLLSAEGSGGDTVFCLDVTTPTAPSFMWEFADPDLYRSRSSPSVAQIGRIVVAGKAKWVAFFVSGKTYDDTLYPSIYVIDIEDGSVLERIFLDVDSRGLGGVPSGQPSLIDSDNNGYIDRIFIGSDKGLLYKVSIPDDPGALNYSISHCVLNTDFTDPDNNTVPEAQRWHPIYASPTVVVENSFSSTGEIQYNVRVFFGTGDSPYYDEDINTASTTYHFFAYVDSDDKGACTSGDLNWFMELPAGHRVFASAFASAGVLYFGTSTAETEDPCDSSGSGNNEGRIFALDIDDGTSLLNEDGQAGLKVGNISTAPLVEDKHLYIRTPTGLISLGGDDYNSAVAQGGFAQTSVSMWREIF
ncbi:MAG: tandem-95 repeat protein, partial [Desulfobacterales bacterium]|nr:tandem-95 repeat protein [Desulfobacterales bacterium]